jgi:RNA polymerase sigma-70 factor (ECF subfamily)
MADASPVRLPSTPEQVTRARLDESLDDRLLFGQARDVLSGLTGCTPAKAAQALRVIAEESALDVADVGRRFLDCLSTPGRWQTEPFALRVAVAASTADADPDGSALARCGEGFLAGLEALYEDYASQCWSLARQMLGDEARAALVVEEAFLDLWSEVGRGVAPPGPAGTWLLMLTHHKAVDRLRDDRRRAAESGATPSPPASLPDEDSRAVLLAFGDGYTQRQVAGLTGVPLATVKSRMRSGLLTLTRSRQESVGPAAS